MLVSTSMLGSRCCQSGVIFEFYGDGRESQRVRASSAWGELFGPACLVSSTKVPFSLHTPKRKFKVNIMMGI